MIGSKCYRIKNLDFKNYLFMSYCNFKKLIDKNLLVKIFFHRIRQFGTGFELNGLPGRYIERFARDYRWQKI